MQAVVCNYGLIVEEAELKRVFKDKYIPLLDSLKFVTTQKIGPPLVCVLYKYIRKSPADLGFYVDTTQYKRAGSTSGNISGGVRDYIILPRMILEIFLEKKIITEVNNKLSVGSGPISPKIVGELTANQKCVLDYLINNRYTLERRAAGTACAVINMKTGSGKSYLAAGLIHALKMKTLYITLTNHLKEQATDDISTLLDCRVSAYDGNETYFEDDVITICIDSAMKLDTSFYSHFGLVILDEIHTYCSPQRRKIFNVSNTCCMLGMSGTTADRKDNFDVIYYKALGKVIQTDQIPGFDKAATDFKLNVKVIKYKGKSNDIVINQGTQRPWVTAMIKNQAIDEDRNKLIIDIIKDLYRDPKRNIIVFVEFRLHADHLLDLLASCNIEADELIDENDNFGDNYEENGFIQNMEKYEENFEEVTQSTQSLTQSTQSLTQSTQSLTQSTQSLTQSTQSLTQSTQSLTQSTQSLTQPLTQIHTQINTLAVTSPKVIVNPNDIMTLKGENNARRRRANVDDAKTSRVIITTYSYSSTGISYKHLNTLIKATPRASNGIQIDARCMRIGSDMTIPRVIIDIVDNNGVFEAQFYKNRKKVYHLNKGSIDYFNVQAPIVWPQNYNVRDDFNDKEQAGIFVRYSDD